MVIIQYFCQMENIKKDVQVDKLREQGLVRQHNIITNTNLNFTREEGRLFICILSGLVSGKRKYSFSVRQIMKMMKLESNRYNVLTKCLDGLYNKSFSIPRTDSDEVIDEVRLIDRKTYPRIDKQKMNGIVEISLSEDIVPYLIDLRKNFTQYEVYYYLQCPSVGSQKLYSLLSQYHNTQIVLRTHKQLNDLFGTTFTKLSNLKQKVLNHSLLEVQNYTNITNVKLVPIKEGRKITGYKFLFKYDKQLELITEDFTLKKNKVLQDKTKELQEVQSTLIEQWLENNPNEVEKKHKELINLYHLTPYQSYTILTNLTIKEINITLHKISINKVNGVINGDIGGYTLGVFRNIYKIKF